MSTRGLTQLRVVASPASSLLPSSRASVEIYRPFFLAGILFVLTVGCLLGSVALLGIGGVGNYTTSTWAPYILAHANSQLFGWVGLFVMGFTLQQHPPTVERARLFHRLAWTSLSLMAIGIALRFVAEPMVQTDRSTWLSVGVFSAALQAIAVVLFVFNVAYTRHRPETGLVWQTRFIFTSLFWLVLISCVEPWVFAYSHQANRADSINFVAQWYPALRDAQFLGFVATMIFGVSLVKLNSCFGAKEPHAELAKVGYFLWTFGLTLRMIGWVRGFKDSFAPSSQELYYFGGALLVISALMLIVASRIFEPLSPSLRAHKFVRGAFAWLIIAGIMVLWEPIHLGVLGVPFSHAYTGAIRHAITVGFISQMILGFGSHVTARMNDLDESKLPALWTVFILVNLGNAARVGLEVASDFTKAAFLPMGFTGFIELVGLGIWAYWVATPMLARKRAAAHA